MDLNTVNTILLYQKFCLSKMIVEVYQALESKALGILDTWTIKWEKFEPSSPNLVQGYKEKNSKSSTINFTFNGQLIWS